MTPTNGAVAHRTPAQRRIHQDSVRWEKQYVKWDLSKWMETHGKGIVDISHPLHVSDATIFNWKKSKDVPFAGFKAIVMAVAPTEGKQLLQELVLETKQGIGQRSKVTPEMNALAAKFDELYDNTQVKTSTGELAVITAPPSAHVAGSAGNPVVKMLTDTDSEHDESDYALGLQRLMKAEAQIEVLLTLSMRMKQERDDAHMEIGRLKAELRLAHARIESNVRQIDKLSIEVKEWQLLAETGTSPQREITPQLPKEVADEAYREVRQRAPSLTMELSRLPKPAGPLS